MSAAFDSVVVVVELTSALLADGCVEARGVSVVKTAAAAGSASEVLEPLWVGNSAAGVVAAAVASATGGATEVTLVESATPLDSAGLLALVVGRATSGITLVDVIEPAVVLVELTAESDGVVAVPVLLETVLLASRPVAAPAAMPATGATGSRRPARRPLGLRRLASWMGRAIP